MLNKNMNICIYKNKNGDIVIFALVFMSIFLVMAAGVLGVVSLNQKYTLQKQAQNHALEIAEAGMSYYHWHLAHNPYDYSDGNGGTGCDTNPPYTCGPYTHDYLDDGGSKIGNFELEITPPPAGSTVINIQSTGWVDTFPNIKRILLTRFGIPSLAEYLFVQNDKMTFSATSETWGKVHSNGKIEFNGTNHSTVESARSGNSVWGAGGPQDLWHWPVPAIDFNKVTQDLSLIKTEAQTNGIYLSNSSDDGYHLILKADNSVDIYKVTQIEGGNYFDIINETFVENRSLNNIHIIFVEDDLWIEGTITNLLTVASARFPDSPPTNTDIMIPNNITYQLKDESHILGLIAQRDIILTYSVPNDMDIQAHLLAQKGSIYRLCYALFGLKNSLTVYGGIIAKQSGGFNCGDPVWSGFTDTYYYANPNAIYHPPPMFPITSTSTLLSWEEIE